MHQVLKGKIFLIHGTTAKVVNYDDNSGLYIYQLLCSKRDFGYKDKQFILDNEIK